MRLEGCTRTNLHKPANHTHFGDGLGSFVKANVTVPLKRFFEAHGMIATLAVMYVTQM